MEQYHIVITKAGEVTFDETVASMSLAAMTKTGRIVGAIVGTESQVDTLMLAQAHIAAKNFNLDATGLPDLPGYNEAVETHGT